MAVLDTDTLVNITKRREEIVYRSSVPVDAVGIAYVSGSTLSSRSNVSIADRSGSLVANRIIDHDYQLEQSVKSFLVETEEFLVTDVFLDETETVPPLPLFYKHTLSTTNVPRNSNGDLDTGVSIREIYILDSTLQAIKVEESKVDLTKGIVYNNLSSSFTNNQEFTVYYVKYVVNNNGTINTWVELLDNTEIFTVADFDDLTPSMTLKTDGRKVYLIEEESNQFRITLPVITDYAYKLLSTAKIGINPPVPSDVTDNWFTRVSNGKFFTNVNGSLRKYHIAEFLTQSFNPVSPIKSVTNETSSILSKTLIKLDYDNIYQDSSSSLYINIMIDKADGTGVAAFTTDPVLAGGTASNGQIWTLWDISTRYGIKSIDHLGGFVEIEGLSMQTSWEATSSYYRTEKQYEFTLIDFNPTKNPDIITRRVSLFIEPDTISTNKSQTLYYLEIDETGRVIESNWDDFSTTSGVMVNSQYPLYYELYPSGWRPLESHENFVADYSVEGNGDILILGDITVQPAGRPESLAFLDIRQRGGGLVESVVTTARDDNPEVQWYWDIGRFDGTPYPQNASYYIEIPNDILNSHGGLFIDQEVRDIINRHTAAGEYAVAKSYSRIVASGVYRGGDTASIPWTKDGFF